jgi:hypothetical protein
VTSAQGKVDCQRPDDFDFHPKAREPLQTPLVGIDIQKKKQGDRGEDKAVDKGADGKTIF